MITATQTATELAGRLADLLGADHVLTGDEDRAFYSQDIYSADDASWRLLEAIKDTVDPRRLVNPGTLGLVAPKTDPRRE